MKPKHLAGAALVMMMATGVRAWFNWLVGILMLAAWRNWWNRWLVIAIGGAMVLELALATVRYLRFTYVLDTGTLTIHSGVFARKVAHIPYDRIQTLQRQQWFFLRPFGLESISIETSGQSKHAAEAKLLAVPSTIGELIEARRTAAGMRRGDGPSALATVAETARVLSVADTPPTAAAPAAPAADETYVINSSDLNRYALSSFGVLPLLAGAGYLYNKLPGDMRDSAVTYLEHAAIALAVGLVVFGIVISLIISYLGIIQRYYHFTLQRRAGQLTITRGYFKRNTVSVRLDRLQAVRIKQTVLRQWLHLSTVQALVASNAAADESDDELVLMPVLPAATALATMQPFVPWLPGATASLRRVPAANRWLYWRNAMLGWAAVGGLASGVAAAYRTQWLAACLGASFALIALGWLQGRYAARETGLRLDAGPLLMLQRGRWFTREQVFVRRANIQAVELSQSWWMKKSQRTHLTVNIREGDGNFPVELRYLAVADAIAVRRWFLQEP